MRGGENGKGGMKGERERGRVKKGEEGSKRRENLPLTQPVILNYLSSLSDRFSPIAESAAGIFWSASPEICLSLAEHAHRTCPPICSK